MLWIIWYSRQFLNSFSKIKLRTITRCHNCHDIGAINVSREDGGGVAQRPIRPVHACPFEVVSDSVGKVKARREESGHVGHVTVSLEHTVLVVISE